MQRSQMEQSRELERRLSDIAVSQHDTMSSVHEVMTSVMSRSRVERLEASTREETNPGLWSARPEVSSRCDLAHSAQAPLLLSLSYPYQSSFVHLHQPTETVMPPPRSLRLKDKVRPDYRRMEGFEFPGQLPLLREEKSR